MQQMATVDAMKMANKEMKKQYGKIDIDKIEVRIPISRSERIDPKYFHIAEHSLRYGRPDRASKRDTGNHGPHVWCTGGGR